MSTIEIEEFEVVIPNGSIYAKKWIPAQITSQTPLILLHDSLGSVELWKDFGQILAHALSRVVVAYDRLGFGKSTARTDLPSIDFIEEEASKYFPYLKSNLGVKNYILLGHSVGGAMAINVAANDSDCEAVITIAAQAFVEDRTIKGIKEAKQSFKQPGQIERLQKWHGAKADWVLGAWTDVWLLPEFSSWSLKNCIGNVNCDVLAIHGDNDQFGSNAFPQYIVNNTSGAAKSLIVKDCGHMPHKEKTEEIVDAVKCFLAGHC